MNLANNDNSEMNKAQSRYERKIARQRQMEAMEAAAVGFSEPMELETTTTTTTTTSSTEPSTASSSGLQNPGKIEKSLRSNRPISEKAVSSRLKDKAGSSRQKEKKSGRISIRRREKSDRNTTTTASTSTRRGSITAKRFLYEDDEHIVGDVPRTVTTTAISQAGIATRSLYGDTKHVRNNSFDWEHEETFAWEQEERWKKKQPNDVHNQKSLSSRLVSGLVSSLGNDKAVRRGSDFISNSLSRVRMNLRKENEKSSVSRVRLEYE